MKRQDAKKISELSVEINVCLDKIFDVTRNLDDERDIERIRRTIFKIVDELYEGIQQDISKEFPEFDPDYGHLRRQK